MGHIPLDGTVTTLGRLRQLSLESASLLVDARLTIRYNHSSASEQ